MTCKDCIHLKLCQANYEYEGSPVGVDEPETAKPCGLFKDRSKFIELPCKLGDDIYYFDSKGNIFKQRVFQFVYGGTGLMIDSDVMFDSDLLGERFFCTREEAEQALKERER